MSQDPTDGKSTLVKVMAWCRQATSHYLNQWWPSAITPWSGQTNALTFWRDDVIQNGRRDSAKSRDTSSVKIVNIHTLLELCSPRPLIYQWASTTGAIGPIVRAQTNTFIETRRPSLWLFDLHQGRWKLSISQHSTTHMLIKRTK